jgi:NAD(P)-dependent dehydrogenase (short-subunit alcohol dehydrogenase family)/acyl carrier protein
MTGADRIFVSAEPPAGMSLDVYARLRPRAAGDAERIADVWARDGRGRTVVALTGVHLRQARGHSSGRESTYGVTWRDTPALPKQTVRASDRWLIVGAPSALRDALAERIRAAAGNVEILNVEALSPDDASLEQRLGAAVAGNASGAPTKILFVARPSASDEESLANDLDETCGAALALCRAMIARGATAKLWFVASGAAPVAASSSSTVAGALFGFGRSMANEHPSLWGGLIDVDGDTSANSASAVLDEVLSDTRDGEVALVSGKRFVARFARLDWPERSEPLALRGDATYVVTGAFGGIGRKLVSRLVERGARRLALFVRRAPSDSERATLDELAQAGTTVRILRVDVGNESDVVRGLEALRADGTPIAGIFHVAGIYNDAVIERMDWPRFASVLGPKLLAAWYLHRHTAGDPLEHFVMFGSGASLLGPVGLSNYAAANAGLDALAHRRRALGLPALTVDWGPWEDTGMAAAVGSVRRAQWADAGFSPMSSDEAFSILESLMNGGPAQAAAFPVEWGVFRASQTGRHALFADVDRPSANSDSRNEPPARASIAVSAASLAALSPDDRVARLTEYLRGEIARELGVRAERVSLTKPINALGFDSLMAVQLRNRAQQALDITIPVSRFIDGSTCEQLARDFVRSIEAAAPAAQPAPEISVDALSDADVDRMLRELLAE